MSSFSWNKSVRLLCVPFVLVSALALLWGADETPPPKETKKAQANAKQAIQKYLFKKTGRTPKGIGTPNKTPWVWCAEQLDAYEKNPKATYYLIGDHLLIADKKYLNSKTAAERRKGLGMVLQACQTATNTLKDKWLGVQICETYIRPHLADADPGHGSFTSEQYAFEVMVDAYAEAQDAQKMIEVFRMMIEKAQNRNTADGARLRLSQVLEGIGQLDEAIVCLKEIDDKAGVGGAKARIPELEKQLAEKKQKEKQK